MPHFNPKEPADPNLVRKYGAVTSVQVGSMDKVGDIGKLMAETGRTMGNTITNTIVQDRGNYEVEILVTLKKVRELGVAT